MASIPDSVEIKVELDTEGMDAFLNAVKQRSDEQNVEAERASLHSDCPEFNPKLSIEDARDEIVRLRTALVANAAIHRKGEEMHQEIVGKLTDAYQTIARVYVSVQELKTEITALEAEGSLARNTNRRLAQRNFELVREVAHYKSLIKGLQAKLDQITGPLPTLSGESEQSDD